MAMLTGELRLQRWRAWHRLCMTHDCVASRKTIWDMWVALQVCTGAAAHLDTLPLLWYLTANHWHSNPSCLERRACKATARTHPAVGVAHALVMIRPAGLKKTQCMQHWASLHLPLPAGLPSNTACTGSALDILLRSTEKSHLLRRCYRGHLQ